MINPVAFSIGEFGIRWYGIAYLLSFLIGLKLAKHCIKFQKPKVLVSAELDTLLSYIIFGVIIGARVGEFVFYRPHELFSMKLFYIRSGGMSFHGGVCGVVIAILLFAKIYKKDKWIQKLGIGDIVCMLAPIGLFLGRMGNYINGEIVGVSTTLFEPYISISRHPVVLYEAFLEGIVLFIILFRRNKLAYRGLICSQFFTYYGIFRFCTEFVRVSDGTIGFLSTAQWLSIAMVMFGASLKRMK